MKECSAEHVEHVESIGGLGLHNSRCYCERLDVEAVGEVCGEAHSLQDRHVQKYLGTSFHCHHEITDGRVLVILFSICRLPDVMCFPSMCFIDWSSNF